MIDYIFPKMLTGPDRPPFSFPFNFFLPWITVSEQISYRSPTTPISLVMLALLLLEVYMGLESTTGDPFMDYGMGSAFGALVFVAIYLLFLRNPEGEGDSFLHSSESGGGGVQEMSILRRLVWGFSVLSTPRGVGWNYEVKNLPPRPTLRRWHFVLTCLLRAFWAFILLDLAQTYIHTNPLFALSGPQAKSITSQGYWLRCLNILAYQGTAYALINLQYFLLCAGLVAVGISEARYCPTLFGRWGDSYTVRRFWGRTWHQMMRRFLAEFGKFTTNLLGFKRGSTGSSYTQLYVAFIISALIHSLGADVMLGLEYLGCSIPFFLAQAVAITFEDVVVALIRRALCGRKVPARWARGVGYIWVFLWFSISMPWLLDPFLVAGCGKSEVLPVRVSLLRRFVMGNSSSGSFFDTV